MTKRELIAKNRDAILAAKHGATNVRVFGSVARGDDDEVSDVDWVCKLGLQIRWCVRMGCICAAE